MARDPQCIFCKIVTGELPASVVYQDEAVVAFLDINPLTEGHLLAIPIYHSARLSDLPVEQVGPVALALPRLGRALLEATGAEGFNLLVNDGKAAGQVVNHMHFHLIPRVTGDSLGYRWNPRNYAAGRAAELSARYQAALAKHV